MVLPCMQCIYGSLKPYTYNKCNIYTTHIKLSNLHGYWKVVEKQFFGTLYFSADDLGKSTPNMYLIINVE